MDIMELGAIGELVGGVAVIASLVYVGLQVRQGNQNEQSAAGRHFTTEWNRAILEPWEDGIKASLLRRAHRDFLALEGEEQAAAHAYWTKVVVLGQQVYFQEREGGFDTRAAKPIEQALVESLKCPGATQWWAVAKTSFTPEFSKYLSQRCAAPSSRSFEETLPWLISDKDGKIS